MIALCEGRSEQHSAHVASRPKRALRTLPMRSLFSMSSKSDQLSMEADVSCPASTNVFISSLICTTNDQRIRKASTVRNRSTSRTQMRTYCGHESFMRKSHRKRAQGPTSFHSTPSRIPPYTIREVHLRNQQGEQILQYPLRFVETCTDKKREGPLLLRLLFGLIRTKRRAVAHPLYPLTIHSNTRTVVVTCRPPTPCYIEGGRWLARGILYNPPTNDDLHICFGREQNHKTSCVILHSFPVSSNKIRVLARYRNSLQRTADGFVL